MVHLEISLKIYQTIMQTYILSRNVRIQPNLFIKNIRNGQIITYGSEIQKNKGLAVFARREIKLEKLNWNNQFKDHQVKYFLPCKNQSGF